MPGVVSIRSRRAGALLLTAAITAGMFATAAPAEATTASEERLAYYHNRARASYGRSSLKLSQSLSDIARAHSRKMRAAGRIFHSAGLAYTLRNYSWTRAGENVGVGPGMYRLHRAFMNSPSHRDNILDRRFRRFGIGAAWDGDRVYVTVIFMNYA